METQKQRVKLTVVETAAADVAVYGAELVGRKALTNMAIILNALGAILNGHKVRTVVFSTETPKDMVANCGMDSGTVTINIMNTFARAFEACIDKPEIAAGFMYWHNIYVSIIHEALHLQNPSVPENEITADAVQALYSIVKEYNIEPGESPFLLEQMREATTYDSDPIIMKQKAMWESGSSFDDGKYIINTYRDFAHLFSGADEKHPEWQQKPKDKFIPIIPFKSETAVHPSAEDIVIQPAATPPITVPAAAVNNDMMAFIQTGINNNTIVEYEEPDDDDIENMSESFSELTDDQIDSIMFHGDRGASSNIVPATQPVYVAPPAPIRVPATPEQMSKIKAFIMAGNTYLPEEHSNIGTPEQMIQITNELFADISSKLGGSPTYPPQVFNQAPQTFHQRPVATVSIIKDNEPEATMHTLPRTGCSREYTAEIMLGVYTKCFNHIFGNCGQLLNSAKGFAYPAAVVDIPIELTDEEKQVVVGYNYHGDINPHNGRNIWCQSGTEAGIIKGFVGTGQGLPSYKLYINMDGVQICRLLLPQNPNKMKGEHLGAKAVLARKGLAIMYIMEGDDAVKNAGGKQLLYKATIERTNFNVPAIATNDSWIAQ